MSTTDIIVDPEFRELIPEPFSHERAQLEANIVADGCREPLVVWQEENILLDGHNRLEICQREGIEYRVTYKSLPNRDATVDWIIRQQFGRRNLPPFIRAELAMKLEETVARQAKERQRDAGGDRVSAVAKALSANSPEPVEPVDTREEIARLAAVGSNTIGKVKAIKNSGDESLVNDVRSGKVSINAAHKAVKAKSTKPSTTDKADCSKEDPAAKDDDDPLVWRKQRARNARTRGREILKHLSTTIPRLDHIQAQWLGQELRPLLVSINRRVAWGTKAPELMTRFREDIAVAVNSIPEDLLVAYAVELKVVLLEQVQALLVAAKGGAA